jgi:anti-sigma28 factor (negative regulator of flagellin synthesis)
MRIQNITHYQSADIKSRLSREKQKLDVALKSLAQDTYEPLQSGPRNDLISAVKKRIVSGFYNSDTVIDDLGDSFAKALNQTS